VGAGLTITGLEHLHGVAESHVGDTLVPGLVALVARGEQVHVEALGTLAVGGARVARDSIFRIASTTKPITAAATLALVGERLIDLDEPVDRLLPELAQRQVLARTDGPLNGTIAATRPVTARDLLTFTFGFGMALEMFTSPTPWPIVQAANALHLATIGPPNPDVQADPDTWIAALGGLPLMAQPGERWLYNTGAQVLGVLLARAAAQPFAEVLSSRIFDPLGMRDTGFWTTQTQRLATAYMPNPDGMAVWDQPDGQWSHRPLFGDGAAGLLCTADDLLAFARMLLHRGGPVLSADAVHAMTSDQLTPAQKAHGGLGPGFFKGRSWAFGQLVLDSVPTAGTEVSARPGWSTHVRPHRHRADAAHVRNEPDPRAAPRHPGRGLRGARLTAVTRCL